MLDEVVVTATSRRERLCGKSRLDTEEVSLKSFESKPSSIRMRFFGLRGSIETCEDFSRSLTRPTDFDRVAEDVLCRDGASGCSFLAQFRMPLFRICLSGPFEVAGLVSDMI